MELLFRDELKEILRKGDFASTLAVKIAAPDAATVGPALQEFSQVQVEEPDNAEFGFVASGVSFVLSKFLNERSAGECTPQILSEMIAERISPERFSTAIGGGGFINAFPTAGFTELFFSDPALRKFFPAQIEISWSARYLQKQYEKSEEAQFLIAELAKRQADRLTNDDARQLLAHLGDLELDSSAYLRGYGGRSNVGWYLDRFENVTAGFEAREAAVLLTPETRELVTAVLHFRRRFFSHLEQQRPERAFRQILLLVSDFFAVFNRPEVRRSPHERLFFVTRDLVLKALSAIKLPCEPPVRVL